MLGRIDFFAQFYFTVIQSTKKGTCRDKDELCN